jgi:predicted nucleic acid-binding protein
VIRRVLVDTDVVLDVATARAPFVTESKPVLALFERRRALGYVSAHSVTTMFYILRKLGDADRARAFLRDLLTILSVATEGHNDIVQALEADFSDFEDAVQHQCAQSNGCDAIVTRNIEQYRTASIAVYTPQEFVATLG